MGAPGGLPSMGSHRVGHEKIKMKKKKEKKKGGGGEKQEENQGGLGGRVKSEGT